MLTAASSVEIRSQVKDIRLQDVIRQIDSAHNPEQVQEVLAASSGRSPTYSVQSMLPCRHHMQSLWQVLG